jgi:general stress protein CsbA
VAGAWMPSEVGPGQRPSTQTRPPYVPLGRYARAATIFIAAAVFFDAVAALSGFQQYLLVARVIRGAATAREIAVNDMRQANIIAFQLGLLLAAAAAFLRWFHHAYANLPALGRTRRRATGWAVGAWFVPLLNLVRPKQMADEIWEAATGASVPLYVHLWWATFLAGRLIGNAASSVLLDDATATMLQTAAGWLVVSDALSVVAGILLIRYIRRVTAAADARAAGVSG